MVEPILIDGRQAWLKHYRDGGSRLLSLGALKFIADKLGIDPLRPPPHHVGAGALDTEARRLSELVPPGLRESREDLQRTFKSALQSGLAKLDLVTREEFEVQRAVLLRTREKLDALERELAALEARVAPRS